MKSLKRPCAKCPFRTDCLKGWLGKSRMEEICEDTINGDEYFICHETTDLPRLKQMLCAGKLLLESKVNPYGNKSTRMAAVMGLLPGGYEYLEGAELIFKTIEEAVKHHSHD